MERAKEHGAIDECLWVKPGYHAGFPCKLQNGYIDIGPACIERRFAAQQANADPAYDQASHKQDRKLEPAKALHQCTNAEKACKHQRDIEKRNDQRSQIRPAALLGERGIDDKQVLQADRCNISKANRQPLQIEFHWFPLSGFTPFS